MAPRTISIDLGELSGQEPPAPPPPWPGWHQLRHLLGRSPWQLGLAAVLALLTAATMTAAVPQESPSVSPHFSVQAHSVQWDDIHLYGLEQNHGAGVLTAYRLADGRAAWQIPVPGETGDVWLTSTDGMLLLHTSPVGLDETQAGDRLTRLDPGAGTLLWSIDGLLAGIAGEHVLLQRRVHHHHRDERESGIELTVVDATTGTPAWQIVVPGGSVVLDPAGPGRLLTLDFEGSLNSYHLRSGELLATVATSDPTDEPAVTELMLHPASATALLRRETAHTFALSGYDATTLEHRWTIAESSTGYQRGVGPWPRMCGPVICLDSRDGFPRGLDPRTGAEIWVADWLEPGHGDLDPPGFQVLEHPGLAGYLEAVINDAHPRSWLIDASSGEPVLDLHGWLLLHDEQANPQDPLMALSGTVMTLRSQVQWLGRVRPDLTGVDVVGAIDLGLGWCVPGRGGYVICRSEPQEPLSTRTVTVWTGWLAWPGTV